MGGSTSRVPGGWWGGNACFPGRDAWPFSLSRALAAAGAEQSIPAVFVNAVSNRCQTSILLVCEPLALKTFFTILLCIVSFPLCTGAQTPPAAVLPGETDRAVDEETVEASAEAAQEETGGQPPVEDSADVTPTAPEMSPADPDNPEDIPGWPEDDFMLPEPSYDAMPDQLPAFPPPVDVPKPLPPFSLQPAFQQAAGDETAPLLLSLRQIVQMVLENNTEVKVQRLQPELGEQQVRFAKGAFDPQFSFSAQYSYSELPQNAEQFVATGGETALAQEALLDQLIELQNSLDELLAQLQGGTPSGGRSASSGKFTDPRIFKSEDFNLSWGLEGKLPLGTVYQIGLTQLQARNDLNRQIPPSLFYPEYTTIMGLTLTQPLLKNFGPAANLAELRVARIQRRAGWYEWQQQLIRSLSQSISLYIDLIFARENLRVREGAVETARLLEEQNIRRLRAGKMRPADVWEAQTSLANNADTALRAIGAYVEAQNNLKAQIFSAADLSAGPTGRLEPVDSLQVPPVTVDRNRFVQEAFTKRPEYLRLTAAAEQEGIKVRYARNQLYPQVDLQASYGLTGLDGNYGDSFGSTFSGDGPAFAVGVLVSVPLGSQKERANLQAAKIRQEQSTLAIQRGSIDITLEIDTAISLVETTRRQIEAAAQTSSRARLTAEAQEKLLEEGKATTFDVVRLQNDYADARSRELAAVANHRKAILRLSIARGVLLEELGVNLEDEAAKENPYVSPGLMQKSFP